MSSPLALAAVTAVLKDLLDNGLIDQSLAGAVGPVKVSALPPDHIVSNAVETESQVNLYLYAVTPNAGWRNAALPARNADGARVSGDPLALDLHYLLTAYGAHDFHTDILLGYAMQLFHETPFLARDAIRRSLTPPSAVNVGASGLPPALAALSTSELADQVEGIKITPEALGTEEMARLWSAFGARYRPTAAYRASVVLIESRRSVRTALPVRTRKLYVLPFAQPVIDRILSQANAAAPIFDGAKILAGHRLVVEGQRLRGEVTRVLVGDVEIAPADVADTRVTVVLPATVRAGVQPLQVIHRLMLGEPANEHRGVESNVAAFVLSPSVAVALSSVASSVVSGTTVFAGNADATFTPPVGRAQRVTLLLNEVNAPTTRAARAYSFRAPPRDPATAAPEAAALAIPFRGVEAGTYLVRAQVDGAESALVADLAEPPGATFGQYVSPTVTLP